MVGGLRAVSGIMLSEYGMQTRGNVFESCVSIMRPGIISTGWHGVPTGSDSRLEPTRMVSSSSICVLSVSSRLVIKSQPGFVMWHGMSMEYGWLVEVLMGLCIYGIREQGHNF